MIFAAWAVTLLWNIGYAWGRVVLGVSGGCVMYVQLANPDKIVIEKPDRDVRAIEIDVDFEARDAPRHWRVTESSPLIWFPEVDTHEARGSASGPMRCRSGFRSSFSSSSRATCG